MSVEVYWSGGFPNLCSGEWTLKVNGKDYSDRIPFQGECAGTAGTYYDAYIDGNYEEQYDAYEDGLDCDAWITENKQWLETITLDESLQRDIFAEFQAADWRHGSCGGCL